MSWFSRILGRNGNVKWKKEFLELETFFGKISETLEDFAATYNLMIEKYPHHGPEWAFRFRHPNGGVGQIEVEKSGHDHVIVRHSYHIDDYDKLTRFLKYPQGERCSLDNKTLRILLEKKLKIVLSWRKEDLPPLKHKCYNWKWNYNLCTFFGGSQDTF